MICPACMHSGAEGLGILRDAVGVISLEHLGALYHCHRCGLFFRHPFPETETLERFYESTDINLWPFNNDRPDFMLASEAIKRFVPYGRVLDVGCFRGDFLGLLPNQYQKFGIEPSDTARKVAMERGITLIAKSIEQLSTPGDWFDAISMIDVIEHLAQPLEVLSRLSGLLRPGGILVVSTGNTDALPWRLMRLDYSYYYPVHICFFNPKWFRWAADRLGLYVIQVRRFSHSPGSVCATLRQLRQCVAFSVVHDSRLPRRLSSILKRIYPRPRQKPPSTHHWKDHIMVVLKQAD